MPRKTFVAGEILTALDVNTNLMDQAVMTFADATERTAELPSPLHGMVTYLKDTDSLEVFDDSAFVPVGADNTGFTAGTAIIATGTFTVPALASPIVRVTVIGGGGGGGGAGGSDGDGGTGGTTTFSAGSNPSAAGGAGGIRTGATTTKNGTAGNASGNGAHGAMRSAADATGGHGLGGSITVAYVNLTGLSTVEVTVGVGGTAGAGSTGGGTGGRGEVIVEYVAG